MGVFCHQGAQFNTVTFRPCCTLGSLKPSNYILHRSNNCPTILQKYTCACDLCQRKHYFRDSRECTWKARARAHDVHSLLHSLSTKYQIHPYQLQEEAPRQTCFVSKHSKNSDHHTNKFCLQVKPQISFFC